MRFRRWQLVTESSLSSMDGNGCDIGSQFVVLPKSLRLHLDHRVLVRSSLIGIKRSVPMFNGNLYRTRSQIALFQKVESAICDRGHYITPSVFGGLEIVSVTSPVSKGSYAAVAARISPSASCSITVYYKSGPSKAIGLEPKTADASGMVSWTWKVGIRTTSGTWRIVVNCNGVTKETMHTVQ